MALNLIKRGVLTNKSELYFEWVKNNGFVLQSKICAASARRTMKEKHIKITIKSLFIGIFKVIPYQQSTVTVFA